MTQPTGLATLNPSTGAVLYGRGQLGSIRLKTSRLSAISFLAVLILCQKHWTRTDDIFSSASTYLKNMYSVHVQFKVVSVRCGGLQGGVMVFKEV